MSSTRHYDQDKDSTLYVGNLDERCTDALVWELMLQAGPIVNVHLPKDRVTQTHQGYGFVEFASEEDADYASKIMNQIRLYGKPIRVNKASADKRGAGVNGEGASVGAELYVGGLDPMVDEKVLYETFSRFGPLVAPPKVSRDDANLSKNYGFISYASFDSSDDAIANMNGQYLMNREITVQYAYKKDGKGERHGDAAERALAAQAKKHGVQVQIPAMPAALVMPNSTPSAPAAMNGAPYAANGAPSVRTPQPPPSYNYGAYQPPPGPPVQAYNAMPPPPQGLPQAPLPPNPSRNYNQSPLQAPPSGAGLPARPPPSMAGYGGPPGNAPGMQPSYPGGPPQPGMAPPGMPPGLPPGPPAGFRPPGPPNGFPPPPNPHQQSQQY
jgi:splicing factor 3B subunit 4